jgi:hypothetical protein
VTVRGLDPVGPEETVPPRQVEAEVAVGLDWMHGVVRSVHVRSHDQPAQDAVQSSAKADVSVVEHGSRVEQDLKDNDRSG